MGVRTTVYAVASDIVDRIESEPDIDANPSVLDFPTDRACALDKAAPALEAFAEAGEGARSLNYYPCIEIADAEIRTFAAPTLPLLRARHDPEALGAAVAEMAGANPGSELPYPFGPGDTTEAITCYVTESAMTLCSFLDEAIAKRQAIVTVSA